MGICYIGFNKKEQSLCCKLQCALMNVYPGTELVIWWCCSLTLRFVIVLQQDSRFVLYIVLFAANLNSYNRCSKKLIEAMVHWLSTRR